MADCQKWLTQVTDQEHLATCTAAPTGNTLLFLSCPSSGPARRSRQATSW